MYCFSWLELSDVWKNKGYQGLVHASESYKTYAVYYIIFFFCKIALLEYWICCCWKESMTMQVYTQIVL